MIISSHGFVALPGETKGTSRSRGWTPSKVMCVEPRNWLRHAAMPLAWCLWRVALGAEWGPLIRAPEPSREEQGLRLLQTTHRHPSPRPSCCHQVLSSECFRLHSVWDRRPEKMTFLPCFFPPCQPVSALGCLGGSLCSQASSPPPPAGGPAPLWDTGEPAAPGLCGTCTLLLLSKPVFFQPCHLGCLNLPETLIRTHRPGAVLQLWSIPVQDRAWRPGGGGAALPWGRGWLSPSDSALLSTRAGGTVSAALRLWNPKSQTSNPPASTQPGLEGAARRPGFSHLPLGPSGCLCHAQGKPLAVTCRLGQRDWRSLQK